MVSDSKLSRRDFLKGSAAAGAALGLGVYNANAIMAAPRVIGANDRIQIGIIGCGNKGTNHLRNLVQKSKNEGKVAVVAVCDIYEPRKNRAKGISGAEVHHDYRKLLERKDIDAVVIATPDHWHALMAIDAMQAGKDVYLEKPMTYTWQEAKRVAEIAKETNRILQVGAQSCSDDRWWKANKLIKEGAIGKVLWTSASFCRNSVKGEWNYPIDEGASPDNLDWNAWLGPAPKRDFDKERYFRWRKYWDYSGGIATDLFYHTLSHLQVALGAEFPKRVSAGGGIYVQHDRDVPDTFHMIID
ncbi:MAG: Gfo/Idh/MocA family oxidoreductase, partial [Armatimonadota bacterium]|nr:Gfo/Idh/MocA family oxidoreductase [Armatimonadota bacterium]